MLLFALSLLFGYGNAADCATLAAGTSCTLINLGTTANVITQVNILDIELNAGNGCSNKMHEWQVFMAGTPTTGTAAITIASASGGTKADFHSSNADCVLVGSTFSGTVWGLAENEAGAQTCSSAATTAVTGGTTCFRLDGEASSTNTQAVVNFPASIKAGTAAKMAGKLYAHASTTLEANETDIFGTAASANNHPEITLIVWKSLADSTCLGSSGANDADAFTTSYQLFCNAQTATVQFYTSGACAEADKVTLAATHKFFTGTTTLAGQRIVLAPGGAKYLGSTTGVAFVADGTTDPCVLLNPPAAGGPASALNTAAAAAVLAAGALIL